MARPKKTEENLETENDAIDFTNDIMDAINKDAGEKVMFGIGDNAPSNVKRWISTGSKQLDYRIANQKNGGIPEGRISEIYGPPSCHGKGDKVLDYKGYSKNVENVQVGDLLLGPDGTTRKVLNIHNGIDELYELTPYRGGKKYIINKNHILALKRAKGTTKIAKSERGELLTKKDEVIYISVQDYLKQSNNFKNNYRQQKVSVDVFQENIRSNPIKPYILGLLLGDGSLCQNRIELTTMDKEIIDEYTNFCLNTFGYNVSYHTKKGNKAIGIYHLNGINPGKKITNDHDLFRSNLNKLGLIGTKSGNKFIPNEYKYSSIEDRKEILAGLIDTDGNYGNNGSMEITSKSIKLAEDIAFIANSLGLYASLNEKYNKKYQTMYYRVHIFGKLYTIPTRLKRKQAFTETRIINTNLTGFSIKPIGKGEFFGFELDKDHLYLTDDFSIFHNSGKSHIAIQCAIACQKMNGLVFYIDTEHASDLEYFQEMGIEAKNFKLVPQKVVEEIFSTIEKIIIMARNNDKAKELPILIIWDSIAASIPRSELEPSEKVQPGRLAAAMSIGLKRIVEVVGSNNVTLLLCNQTRTKIGVMFGDPEESAGGNAIKFYSSVRIKLSGKTKITDDKGNIVGNKIYCTIEKNKVAPPMRKCEIEIHFGVGIVESDYVFDNLKIASKGGPFTTENYKYYFADGGAWKNISITNIKTGETIDRKLRMAELQQFFAENVAIIEEAMEKVYVYKGVKNPLDGD